MSGFNLQASLDRAEKRMGDDVGPPRSRRQDRGRSRLEPEVRARLEELLHTRERPRVRTMQRDLADYCSSRGLPTPARATIYQAMASSPAAAYSVAALPRPVQEALYNLDDTGCVPGHQLAFYCLNYGDVAAASFAAGLPWRALYQAARLRGWRPKSAGLLRAIRRVRRI